MTLFLWDQRMQLQVMWGREPSFLHCRATTNSTFACFCGAQSGDSVSTCFLWMSCIYLFSCISQLCFYSSRHTERIPHILGFSIATSSIFINRRDRRRRALLNGDLRATLRCMQNTGCVTAELLLGGRKLRTQTTNEHSEMAKCLFAAHFLTV